jgi:hypothetical protein
MSDLLGILNPSDPRAVASAVRSIAQDLGIDRLRARVTCGAASGGLRTWTVQVVDRRGQPVNVQAMVWLWVATEAGGEPDGTQSVSFPAGTVRFTYRVGQEWVVKSTVTGLIQLEVTADATARFVHAAVMGDVQRGSEA